MAHFGHTAHPNISNNCSACRCSSTCTCCLKRATHVAEVSFFDVKSILMSFLNDWWAMSSYVIHDDDDTDYYAVNMLYHHMHVQRSMGGIHIKITRQYLQTKQPGEWNQWSCAYLLLVLPSRRVQRLDEGCGVTHEHGVTGGAHNHT